MSFLGEVKPFLSSGDRGELEEGEESKGNIKSNVACFALPGSSSVSHHCYQRPTHMKSEYCLKKL